MLNVPSWNVKLVAAVTAVICGEVLLVSLVVLQVTLSVVPVVVSVRCERKISLLAVTAVVFTVHVPVEALVEQATEPAGAAVHDATEGFAAVPVAAQLVNDPYRLGLILPALVIVSTSELFA